MSDYDTEYQQYLPTGSINDGLELALGPIHRRPT